MSGDEQNIKKRPSLLECTYSTVVTFAVSSLGKGLHVASWINILLISSTDTTVFAPLAYNLTLLNSERGSFNIVGVCASPGNEFQPTLWQQW